MVGIKTNVVAARRGTTRVPCRHRIGLGCDWAAHATSLPECRAESRPAYPTIGEIRTVQAARLSRTSAEPAYAPSSASPVRR